MKLLFNYKI